MRHALLAVTLCLALAAPARADELDDRFEALSQVFADRDYRAAADGFAELAADYEARYPSRDKQRYFCGSDLTQALLGAATGAEDGTTTVVLGPEWCEALFMQAYSYVELQMPQKAVAPLRRVAALSPFEARYAVELAFVLRSTGSLDEAMAEYERADSVAQLVGDAEGPRYRGAAWRGICWIHAERREWDAAEKACRTSLEHEPGNAIALGELDYIAQQRARD